MQKNETAANNRKTIESYIPMVKFIAAVCGPRCEVALHDLDDINHSIVAIENGHITGRKVGDGLVDFALASVFDKSNKDKAFIANIYGKTTDEMCIRDRVKSLENHADRFPCLPQLLGAEGSHLFSVHHHAASGGPLQQVDAPH